MRPRGRYTLPWLPTWALKLSLRIVSALAPNTRLYSRLVIERWLRMYERAYHEQLSELESMMRIAGLDEVTPIYRAKASEPKPNVRAVRGLQ
jgi:hypothetical protein